MKVTVIAQEAPIATPAPQLLVWAKSPLAVMDVIAKAALPELVKVTACGPLVLATTSPVKTKLAGDKVTTGAWPPLPLSGRVCGLPGALSATVMAPEMGPEVVGVKVTLIVQLAPLASVDAQLLDSAKLALAAMLMIVRVAPPVLVNTALSGALEVLMTWLAKLKLDGRKATAGAEVLFPAISTVCGELAALSVIVTDP